MGSKNMSCQVYVWVMQDSTHAGGVLSIHEAKWLVITIIASRLLQILSAVEFHEPEHKAICFQTVPCHSWRGAKVILHLSNMRSSVAKNDECIALGAVLHVNDAYIDGIRTFR